jgi:hypothetical protein
MPYVVPAMPLAVNIWIANNVANPPDVVTVGNLSPGKRGNVNASPVTTNATLGATVGQGLYMELLCPKLTDIRGCQNAGLECVVECPASSGRFYLVIWVDDVGKGFANEHRLAIMVQCNELMVAATTFISIFGNVPPWPSPLP